MVLIAAARLMGLKLDDELTQFEEKNKEKIAELQNLVGEIKEVRAALAQERLALAYLYETAGLPDKAAEALQKAKSFVATSAALTDVDVSELAKRVRRRLRRLHEDLSDRYGFKLDISLSDVGGIIAIWSVLFLVSGYLYTSTLLSALGVDASAFLGIGDYLSASVDQIRYAGFATCWGAFVYFAGAFEGSRKSRAQIGIESEEKERIRNSIWILIAVLVAASLWTFWFARDLFFGFARFAGILLSIAIADYLGGRAFSNPTHAAALLTAVLTFSVHMATGVAEQIHQIQTGKWKPKMHSQLVLNSGHGPTPSSGVVLAGAGDFLVLLDQSAKQVIVIPKSRVWQVNVVSEQ